MFDDELLARAACAARDASLEVPDTPPPEHVFSDAFEAKMQALLRAQQKTVRMKKLMRFSRRAAVFMVAGFVGISTCVLSVDAWRVKLFEMVEKKTAEYSEITYQPIAGASESASDSSQYTLVEYRPAYLPEGMRLTSQILSHGINWCQYTAADKREFSFNQSIIGTVNSSINTEGGELIPFQLGDNDAFKMTNCGTHFVLWSDERYEFSLRSNDTSMTLDEAIKIAASVTVSPLDAPHPPELALDLDLRPMDYPVGDAVKNGDIVLQGGTIQNRDVLDGFFAQMERGEPAIVCVADYNAPKLLLSELYFDGFRVSCDTDLTRRDGDETNHFSEGRNYDRLIRETENGETIVFGIAEGAEKSELWRYKAAE